MSTARAFSSKGETVYAVESDKPNRIASQFLERVLSTEFRIDAYQETYFVIVLSSNNCSTKHTSLFAPLYEKLGGGKPNAPGAVLPGDGVIHRGGGAGSS